LDLHGYLTRVAKAYEAYKLELEAAVLRGGSDDSVEFRDKLNAVFLDFKEKNSENNEYARKRDRYDRLHLRLNHLRDLIDKWDANVLL
jgi:hypothetical protein